MDWFQNLTSREKSLKHSRWVVFLTQKDSQSSFMKNEKMLLKLIPEKSWILNPIISAQELDSDFEIHSIIYLAFGRENRVRASEINSWFFSSHDDKGRAEFKSNEDYSLDGISQPHLIDQRETESFRKRITNVQQMNFHTSPKNYSTML